MVGQGRSANVVIDEDNVTLEELKKMKAGAGEPAVAVPIVVKRGRGRPRLLKNQKMDKAKVDVVVPEKQGDIKSQTELERESPEPECKKGRNDYGNETPKRKRKRSSSSKKIDVVPKTRSDRSEYHENLKKFLDVGWISENEYEIERITGFKIYNNDIWFLAKWKGWPQVYSTWEPEENIVSCPSLVADYFSTNFKRFEAYLKFIHDPDNDPEVRAAVVTSDEEEDAKEEA